jgi:hypothetical protein
MLREDGYCAYCGKLFGNAKVRARNLEKFSSRPDMNQTTTPAAFNFQATMNAVVISDDVNLAGKVHNLLDDVSDRAQESTRWRVSSWRLDQLMSPPSEKSVLNETGAAHLIVLALNAHADSDLKSEAGIIGKLS